MRKLALMGLFCTQALALCAQSEVAVNGMVLKHKVVGKEIEFTLSAPTTGWVGIGFNDANEIVGADLLLFHIVNGKVAFQDMIVKGLGDPRLDTTLGGTDDVKIISGEERGRLTEITFRLPLQSNDPNDFALEKGKTLWLIMAYSTHDEFDHHSRMRKHIRWEVGE